MPICLLSIYSETTLRPRFPLVIRLPLVQVQQCALQTRPPADEH